MTVIKTKLIWKKARIIRRGMIIRGKSMIDLGIGLTTGINCRIEALCTGKDDCIKIKIGNKVQMNDSVHIAALESVTIGDNVLIASHVYISDNSHGCYKGGDDDTSPSIPPVSRYYFVNPVKIGSNVWIGESAMIMPGVTIGNGAIIGAHAVVNRSIPDNCIAAGIPAKIIKRYNETTKRWEKTAPDGSFI
ncbi:MAG: acetyltransferase [Bacteroides sp.]|nr:acetyltransferase [Bacteroides sp.]